MVAEAVQETELFAWPPEKVTGSSVLVSPWTMVGAVSVNATVT